MTHMPPQFRGSGVLIDEWRRRAAEYRVSNSAVADVYERCADELRALDIHTEAPPTDPSWMPQVPGQRWMVGLAAGVLAAGILVAGFTASQAD